MYDFTETDAAVEAASRMGIRRLSETGRIPPGATYENIPPIVRDAIKADMFAIAQVMAPIIAFDVFVEVRSALQRIAWGSEAELTDEQAELWRDVKDSLSKLGQQITEGKRT